MDSSAWMARCLKQPPLPRAELDALLRQYADAVSSTKLGHDGKRAARIRQRIVEVNLRLVMTAAKRVKLPRGWEPGDLLACGAEGLDVAVRRFDLARGFAFSTFALWWIRHRICRSLQDLGLVVRIPVHAQESARKPKNERDQQVRDEVEAVRNTYSFDAPVHGTDGSCTPFGDLLQDGSVERVDDVMGADEALAFVQGAMADLPERERRVIELRYVDNLPLHEVGTQLGLSREGARQMELRALARIRSRMVS